MTTAPDTRDRILEAALAAFREHGFAEATMREIAARAGVATGLADHYFQSKDAFVLAFYQRALRDLRGRLEAAQTGRTLAVRLGALIETKLEYFGPNRKFLGALMGHAADPSNPLSPFSEASREIRDFDIATFERALVETRTLVPADLRPHLGTLLWCYQMGVILFWIYDTSPGQRRTRDVLSSSLHLVTLLIRASNIPLLRPARKHVLALLSAIGTGSAAEPAARKA